METQTLDDVGVPAALATSVLRAWELDPLYRYLLEHGVQLAWLAGQLGMTRGYLVQMFRGQMAPPPGFIERAAEVLEIPVARVRPKSSAARQVKRASEERDDDGAAKAPKQAHGGGVHTAWDFRQQAAGIREDIHSMLDQIDDRTRRFGTHDRTVKMGWDVVDGLKKQHDRLLEKARRFDRLSMDLGA